MIHNSRRNQKKQKGITLVALVVTIVILIILATITINVVFDDGGLIDIVKGAKNDAEDLVQCEDKKMNDLLQEYANIMGGDIEIPEPEPEVDTIPPIVTVTSKGITTNSITVNVQATDNESGMKENPTYTYYIKKSSEADSSYQAKATDVTNSSYTFAGLQQETSYDIKVEVDGDKAGNVGTGELTGQTTTKIPGGDTGVEEGAITFGTTTWSGGKASITVSTNTGMQIQYQVDSTSGSWTNISNGGTVGSLQHGQTVYARLTDRTNYGDYASASIVDETPPTVSSITTGTITETSIQVTVSASDGQSGLATSNTYKFYQNGTLKSTQASNSYTFTGLAAGTQYTIKVEAYDKAGNKGTKTIAATTETNSYVGYYADIEGDGTVDGIIYADLAKGNTGDGQWTNSKGNYKIPVKTNLKDYYISKKSHSGDFGTKDVISPIEGQSEKNDRFYIMALDDIDGSSHYWYNSAEGKMSIDTKTEFGTGNANTQTMIRQWNSNKYPPQDNNDMWKLIQTQASKGWFVPSKEEWSAFAEELGITKLNYQNKGLCNWYWTSSQSDESFVWYAEFNAGSMFSYIVNSRGYVRLSATF